MKLIPLTRGQFAMVDDEDYERLTKHSWCASRQGDSWRAESRVTTAPKVNRLVRMHRLVLNHEGKESVDHIDGNPLNNQKSNLRVCSHKQNLRNTKRPKNNTSGYKGVTFHKVNKRWIAQIKVNQARIHIGSFATPEEAASAYDSHAKMHFGQYAKLNNT